MSDYFPPNPIFNQLTKEFVKAGRHLPWYQPFRTEHMIHLHYGMMVMNPSDAFKIINPA